MRVTPAGASVAVLDLGTSGPVRVYVGGLGSCTTVGFAGVTGHPGLAGVRVVPAAGHALMDDNLDGFVAAIV